MCFVAFEAPSRESVIGVARVAGWERARVILAVEEAGKRNPELIRQVPGSVGKGQRLGILLCRGGAGRATIGEPTEGGRCKRQCTPDPTTIRADAHMLPARNGPCGAPARACAPPHCSLVSPCSPPAEDAASLGPRSRSWRSTALRWPSPRATPASGCSSTTRRSPVSTRRRAPSWVIRSRSGAGRSRRSPRQGASGSRTCSTTRSPGSTRARTTSSAPPSGSEIGRWRSQPPTAPSGCSTPRTAR